MKMIEYYMPGLFYPAMLREHRYGGFCTFQSIFPPFCDEYSIRLPEKQFDILT